jgi:hypothetical protein
MATENAEIFRAAFDGFNRGDWEAVIDTSIQGWKDGAARTPRRLPPRRSRQM